MRVLQPAMGLAAVAVWSVIQASTFMRLEIPDLVQGADRGIYAGRVTETHSVWNPEHTMIWTEATLLVTEDLGGGAATGRTLRFRIPGGVVDGYRIQMEGAPHFETGDETLVFATSWPDGSLMVHGYFQGISSVRLGPTGQETLVGGRADGMTLAALRAQIQAIRSGR